MSLINKMLQDLEQRSDASSRSQPLVGDVRAVASAGASRPRVGVLIALLVLGGIALAAAWITLRPSAPKPALASIAARPAVAAMVAAASAPVAVASAPPAQAKPKPAIEAPAIAAATPASANPVLAQAVIKKPSQPAADDAASDPVSSVRAPEAAPPAKSSKRFTPQQQADNLYLQAFAQLQQGRSVEARQNLQQVLGLNADHVKARQLLASLLIEANALDDAAALLREGLKRSPSETAFSMALARLQLESGEADKALETLAQSAQTAGDEPQYHGFYAVLLQRAKRHDEAVQHYLLALRSDPAMPNWLVGIGISLQEQGRNSDAAEAFARARDGGLLNAQLLEFVEQRLQQLP